MKQFPPNTEPKNSTLTAMIVGYLLISDFTYLEQNAIGSWFVVVGEILKANGSYGMMLQGRVQEQQNASNNGDIATLHKAIERIYYELDKIKKEL